MNMLTVFVGGPLFNCLCGLTIGAILAVTFGARFRKRVAIPIIAALSALLITAAILLTWKLWGRGPVGFVAGLLTYPFINKATAWHPIPFGIAAILDAGLMTLSGSIAWSLTRRRQDRKNANKTVHTYS